MGVWFAVLFSLSSLAIRGSLLEALVVVTHIDYLFPAASPPLGAVPRAIMALLIAWVAGILLAALAVQFVIDGVKASGLL